MSWSRLLGFAFNELVERGQKCWNKGDFVSSAMNTNFLLLRSGPQVSPHGGEDGFGLGGADKSMSAQVWTDHHHEVALSQLLRPEAGLVSGTEHHVPPPRPPSDTFLSFVTTNVASGVHR